MEAFGTAAASLELTKFTRVIIRKIKDLKQAPKAVANICSELELMQNLLRRVESLADDDLTLETHLGRFE